MESTFFVGVDVGQVQDPTAIAVLERKEMAGEWDAGHWAHRKEIRLRLRNLHRVPLGTSYPEVAARVCRVTTHAELRGRCRLAVDATGVGRPVVEMIQGMNPGCRMQPVLITGGARETMTGGYHHVPKRDLITRLQILLQQGRLQIAARMKDAAELANEMAEMRVTKTPSGNEQFAAREGAHDDLVLAVALACWACEKEYPRPPQGREAFITRSGVSAWEREVRREVQGMGLGQGRLL